MTDSEVAALRDRFQVMAALLVDDRFVSSTVTWTPTGLFTSTSWPQRRTGSYRAFPAELERRAVIARSFRATPVTSQWSVDVQREITEAFERWDATAAKRAVRRYGDFAKERAPQPLAGTGGHL